MQFLKKISLKIKRRIKQLLVLARSIISNPEHRMNLSTIETVIARSIIPNLEHRMNLSTIETFYYIEMQKSYLFQKEKDKTKPSILIIAQLHYFGGVESRVYKYINTLKESFNIFVLAPKDHFYSKEILNIDGIFCYRAFSFSGNTPYLSSFVCNIIAEHNISRVEFNITWAFEFDYRMISHIPNTKTIAIFHAGNPIESSYLSDILKYVHYCFTVNLKNVTDKVKVLYNGIHLKRLAYEHPKDHLRKNIILISRLDPDKWESIENCLVFATENRLSVSIAGIDTWNNNIIYNNIHNNFPELDIQYLGLIDTQEYLLQNYNKYLFVAGVGQVVLESASVGFPTAISSMTKNMGMTFLTKENFFDMLYNNFSKIPQSDTIQSDFEKIQQGDLEDFNVIPLLEKDFDIVKQVEFYKNNYLYDLTEEI